MALQRINNGSNSLSSFRATYMGLTSILIALILILATVAVSYAQTPTPTPDPESNMGYDESEAYAIDSMIMCPVCPAETIDQAQVPLARQMKQIIRQKLGEGYSREAILEYFVARYGESILAAPPKRGFNLVAWIFPIVVLIGALGLGFLGLRSMKQKNESGDISDKPGLEPYLEMVDDILAKDKPEAITQRKAIIDPDQSGDSSIHG